MWSWQVVWKTWPLVAQAGSVSFHQWSAPDNDNKDGRGRVTSIPGVIILLLRPPSQAGASDLTALHPYIYLETFRGRGMEAGWLCLPQLEYIYKHQASGWKIEAGKKSDIFILKPLSELKLFLSSRKSKILGQRNCSVPGMDSEGATVSAKSSASDSQLNHHQLLMFSRAPENSIVDDWWIFNVQNSLKTCKLLMFSAWIRYNYPS